MQAATTSAPLAYPCDLSIFARHHQGLFKQALGCESTLLMSQLLLELHTILCCKCSLHIEQAFHTCVARFLSTVSVTAVHSQPTSHKQYHRTQGGVPATLSSSRSSCSARSEAGAPSARRSPGPPSSPPAQRPSASSAAARAAPAGCPSATAVRRWRAADRVPASVGCSAGSAAETASAAAAAAAADLPQMQDPLLHVGGRIAFVCGHDTRVNKLQSGRPGTVRTSPTGESLYLSRFSYIGGARVMNAV